MINKQIKPLDTAPMEAFIKDITNVCLKHKMTISHEDGHGSFIIEDYNYKRIEWLKGAIFVADGTDILMAPEEIPVNIQELITD